MIAAGAAGGLAAAFNAPIAGTMFVLEEVYHNFSPLVWITSLASAVGANFISLNVFGEVPVLHLVYDRPLPVSLYWHLLLLGVLLGVLGFAYQKKRCSRCPSCIPTRTFRGRCRGWCRFFW